jgi:predicted Fe-Mo cluster-binding NifX family protein
MADWVEGFEEWSYRAEEYVEAEADNWIVYAVEDGLITRVHIHSDRAQAYAAAGITGS